MIPEYLALEGFVGYSRRTELDFTGREVIAVTGPNQVGKSTLLHAMCYALYGRTLATRDEQLLNDFCDRMVVEQRVLIRDKPIEITRGREADGALICKVAGFETRKPSEAAAYIAERIGLSYTDFIGLQYFQQGDIHGFMSGDKRSYFQRWTSSLALWRDLEKQAGENEKEAQRKLDSLDMKKTQAESTTARAAEIKAEARAAAANATKTEADADLINEAVRKLQTQIMRSESQEAIKEAIDNLRSQLASIDTQIVTAEAAVKRLDKQLEQEKEGVCPLLNISCPELSDSIRDRKVELRNQISKQGDLIEDLQQQREIVVRKGKKLKKKVVQSSVVQLKGDLVKARRDLNEANREHKIALRRKAIADAALQAIDEAEAELKLIDTRIKKQSAKLRRAQFLRFMCGRNGVPAALIESELQHVEEQCNWVFKRLDSPKQIRFRGYRELGAFEKICPVCGASSWHAERCKECGAKRPRKRKEEPTVTILEGSIERPFELESGGAKILTSLAVRLSSGLFVSAMTGMPIDALFLDEVFVHLDQSNRAKVMGMVIDKLRSEFGIQRQFVVSHADDITHTIDDLIVVSKERGSSVARWA